MTHIKKKILFVIDSLAIGGAEKSLVTLLSMLDYAKYDVDLQLFAKWGQLLEFIPKQVNQLPEIPYITFLQKSTIEQLRSLNPLKLFPGYIYRRLIRKHKLSTIDSSCAYWKCFRHRIERNNKHYDIAIGYGQGTPTMYVADKVTASKKLAWINACYAPEGKSKDFLRNIYSKIDSIVPVSDGVKKIFSDVYPEFENKMAVIWDIINPTIINQMSTFPRTIKFDHEKPVIITLSRLECDEKGMDITLQVAKVLNDNGLEATWHIFGEGSYHTEMTRFINENNLSGFLFLHGAVNNPYPYLADATIYVQTSRAEGFGLSVAEARLLNKPIVTTAYKGVDNQIIDGENGIVTSLEPHDIAKKIINLLSDKPLYEKIRTYLKSEKKGNPEEINKIYDLFEN